MPTPARWSRSAGRSCDDSLRQISRSLRRLEEIDPSLHGRVADRLKEAWDDCDASLRTIEVGAADNSLWSALASTQGDIQRLGQETLAYVAGSLARQAGSDEGLCALADLLLDHIGSLEPRLNWRGFAVLAETSFLGDLAEVVRLRYPGFSYWHLPMAAHEFGHFATPTIRVRKRDGSFIGTEYPVEAFLEQRWDRNDQKKWFHAHEHLADIFATYVLGAAYAYYVLFLEIRPTNVRSVTTTHPSWRDRVAVITQTLGRLVQSAGVTSQILDDVEMRWRAILELGDAEAAQPDPLSGYVDFLLPMLDRHLKGLRYSSFPVAQQLAGHLRAKASRPSATLTPRDIINASWLARLDDPDPVTEADRIAERAVQLLRDVS